MNRKPAEPGGQLPALPWHGSCQCGKVHYTLREFPLTFYCCHCTQCQKQSASMHGESVLIRCDAVEVSGETKIWSRKTDSGNRTDCHFCPDCGVRIFHQGTHRKEADQIISIKGGTLEHIGSLEPVGHIWMKSAQAGFRPDPTAMLFDVQPESYQSMIEAFSERYCQTNDNENDGRKN